MSHDLLIENGEASMFYVGTVPWHGLGTRLEAPPRTTAEAIKAAHLDWDVGLKPVYAWDGGQPVQVEDRNAVVRLDKWNTPEAAVFGLVGPDYTVLQNREAFHFFDPILETGEVSCHTAGAIDGGRRVWVLGKIEGNIMLGDDDEIERYLLLSTGHDGRTAVQIRFTPVRVVCQNTLNAALKNGSDLFRLTHTPPLQSRLRAAQAAVQEIISTYAALEKAFHAMVARKLTASDHVGYLKTVFPDPKRNARERDQTYASRVRTVHNRRQLALDLAHAGPGGRLRTAQDTLWGAYNGVTCLVDHHWPYRNVWHRFESACFGDGEGVKLHALLAAAQLAGVSVGNN
jgi:phage/plasmid-like protein (TIGR03299 family)